MESRVTMLVSSTDGTVYLRTQHGENSEEIAEALLPYVGRFVHFYPPNMYGHINPERAARGWLRAVDGTQVTVHIPATDYTGTWDALEAFGNYCTMINPAPESE